MAVSLSLLASGSRANCGLVASSTTRILVDAGLSCRETFKRLRALGEKPEQLSAILITHEHSDHVAGLQPDRRRNWISRFSSQNRPTANGAALCAMMRPKIPVLRSANAFASGCGFQVWRYRNQTRFTIPHGCRRSGGLHVFEPKE